ncbi:MAG: hypothetical protein ACE5JD_12895 [Candidatus Methylomirabilia bacterium]
MVFAPRYGRMLTAGGSLILGGILLDEEASVEQELVTHGLTRLDRVETEGWVSLGVTGDG